MKKAVTCFLALVLLATFSPVVSLAYELPMNSPWVHKYDPPITLSQNRTEANLIVEQIPEGYSLEVNAGTDWLRDVFGINNTVKWHSDTENAMRLNLAMASNDLPDMIFCRGTDLGKLVESGMLLPLEDLLEEYASPLVKYILDEFFAYTNDTYFSPFTVDGHLYAIPTLVDVWAGTWQSTFIRADILEELGKEIPGTLEELEDIFATYTAAYPGGTAHILANDPNTGWIVGMNPAMEAAGAHPYYWVERDDGTLGYGSILPEAKKGLEILARWYENGWLDPEFIVKDESKAKELFVAGDALSMYEWWWTVWNTVMNLAAVLPDSSVLAYPPIYGENGEGGVRVLNAPSSLNTDVRAISAACEHPEAYVYMMNIAWDSAFRVVWPAEVQVNLEFRDMMKREYDYDFIFPMTEARQPLNPDDPPGAWVYDWPEELVSIGLFNEFSGYSWTFPLNERATHLIDQYLRIIDYDARGVQLNEADELEKEKYLSVSPMRWETLASAVTMWEALVNDGRLEYDAFVGTNPPAMVEKGAYLNKLELEAYTAIIMGEKGIDSFDTFVEEWLKAGGQEVIDQVNEWYKGM